MRAAADVEEVRGETAGILHRVHRAHAESRAVRDDADVRDLGAVVGQLRVVRHSQADRHGRRLILIGRLRFVPLRDVGMLVEAVVVEIDLRVRGDDAAVFGQHERVDLDQVRAVVHEQCIERAEQTRKRFAIAVGQLRRERQLTADVRRIAGRGIDPIFVNRAGVVLGDFLDVHAAL